MARKKPARDRVAAQLADVAFFKGFSSDQLRRVAELAEECEAEPGGELIGQGRPGQEAFVILDGSAGIYIGGKQVNELGPGELVGEMSLIDHSPRSADVRALTPMKLLVFDSGRFRRLLDDMPEALIRVMERLIERKRLNASAEE